MRTFQVKSEDPIRQAGRLSAKLLETDEHQTHCVQNNGTNFFFANYQRVCVDAKTLRIILLFYNKVSKSSFLCFTEYRKHRTSAWVVQQC